MTYEIIAQLLADFYKKDVYYKIYNDKSANFAIDNCVKQSFVYDGVNLFIYDMEHPAKIKLINLGSPNLYDELDKITEFELDLVKFNNNWLRPCIKVSPSL